MGKVNKKINNNNKNNNNKKHYGTTLGPHNRICYCLGVENQHQLFDSNSTHNVATNLASQIAISQLYGRSLFWH